MRLLFHKACGEVHPLTAARAVITAGALGLYLGYCRCKGVTLHVYATTVEGKA